MKNKLLLGLFACTIIAFTISCGGEKDGPEKVEMDGSEIEMVFKEFNNDGFAVVEISNHMESDMNEFRAHAIWLDKDGNYILGYMDEPDDYPFQQIDRNMVPAGTKVEFKTMIRLEDFAPEEAASVEIKIISAKFKDKTEWIAEEDE